MKIARINSPTHRLHGTWVYIKGQGTQNSRIFLLNGSTNQGTGAKISNNNLSDIYQANSYNIDTTNWKLQNFPLRLIGPANAHTPAGSSEGHYEMRAPDQPLVPVPPPTRAPKPPAPGPSPTMPRHADKPAASSRDDGPPLIRIDALPHLIQASKLEQPIMIWGPPGIGKSDAVKQYADHHDWKLYDLRLSLLEPIDLRGMPLPDPSTRRCVWLPPAFLPHDPEERCVLFLDEINTAVPTMQASCYQLSLNRRIGEYILPRHCRVIAAGNRLSDRGVVFRMPAPLANRFSHLEVAPDINAWRPWAVRNGVSPLIVAFLSQVPDLLFKMTPETSDNAWCSPRSWTNASHYVTSPSLHERDRQIGICSCVGKLAGNEFNKFLKDARKMPDPLEILHRDGIRPPSKLNTSAFSALAISVALQCEENDQQLERACRYAAQMNHEWGTLLVRTLEERFTAIRLARLAAYNHFVSVAGIAEANQPPPIVVDYLS